MSRPARSSLSSTKSINLTMAFDVTTHNLVPKHVKISDSEKEKFLQEQVLATRQLPKILKTDPAILHLKTQAGDIIKVERKSITAGVSLYYRVVVDE